MHVVESTAGVMDTEKVPDGVDLVPGYYEGGLKVWESSIDLVRYLRGGGSGGREDGWDGAANVIQAQHQVLELGCGHGLPGIEALQQGAAAVCFMDLNEEVLIGVTSPNIALNLVKAGTGSSHQEAGLMATVEGKVTLVSGDWEEASPLLPTSSTTTTTTMQAPPCSSFDVILTAETIYTTQVTQKLLEMIQRHLTKPSGVALVAGKRYYFGTGGSVVDLVSRAEALGFQTRVVESIKDGKSNIRDLVELKWK
jgi:predicted nicotinamide N-methyase